jgi:hypothetical protein
MRNFHQDLPEQQDGCRDEHARSDFVVGEQSDKRARLQQRHDQNERQPPDRYGKQNPPAQIPLTRAYKPRHELRLVERTSPDQRHFGIENVPTDL